MEDGGQLPAFKKNIFLSLGFEGSASEFRQGYRDKQNLNRVI